MNKKNLSVVMAGAMLATSVAPVLAETTTENTYKVTKGNMGLLIDRLDTLFEEAPKFEDDTTLNGALAGESVYAYQIREAGTNAAWPDNEGSTDTEALKAYLNDGKEYELRVIDRGYRTDEDGKIVSKTEGGQIYRTTYSQDALKVIAKAAKTAVNGSGLNTLTISSADLAKYPELKGLAERCDSEIKQIYVNGQGANLYDGTSDITELRINTKNSTVSAASDANLSIKPGSKLYDFTKPNTNTSGTTTFPVLEAVVVADPSAPVVDIEETTKYIVNIVLGDVKVEYKVTDLYDGLMLTDKGHELLTEINTVNKKAKDDSENYNVTIENKGLDVLNNKFTVTIKNNGVTTVVTITGTSKENAKLNTLKDWLEAGKANVDILAGDNRYATAVEIAKTYVATAHQYLPSENNSTRPQPQAPNSLKNIVLVNGEALVDGLAAAPYAHATKAPILLTADNKLPKETKDYLKELVSDYKVGSLPEINIIGGEAVVSANVVEELKDMGFKVKRIAGDNREETSLAVADRLEDKLGSSVLDKAFVVGAEGEADAMSIASYASASNTPIIVSKSAKGLSTVGLNEAGNYENVEIIGGESVVPKADEEALAELVDGKVTRIEGANRFETNANVIKKYHRNFEDVLVAKDGQKKESELVDALAVSIFASSKAVTGSTTTTAAPIVLATSKLSDAQLNEVVKYCDKDTTGKEMTGTLYQVGYGVERSVMQKLAEKLGLTR